ncbi:hypothetical protein Sj15T_17670 [Sphingobium sp. TA15]|nr:hypothetical protein Sj15T_17670 [Sphingobium sp. TA15]
MTSGCSVLPPALRRWMAGTVRRFIGAGVGLARLVDVSSVKVVDMAALYRRAAAGANRAICWK